MSETATLSPPAAKRVVRFLTRDFDAFTEGLGHTSNVKKAKFVGCGIATMSRIRAGKQNPGTQFIAAVYTAVAQLPREIRDEITGEKFFDFSGDEH
jgi:hypothetical protein